MHAWGMFAKEGIEEGALVCKYVGEEIRKAVRLSIVTVAACTRPAGWHHCVTVSAYVSMPSTWVSAFAACICASDVICSRCVIVHPPCIRTVHTRGTLWLVQTNRHCRMFV